MGDARGGVDGADDADGWSLGGHPSGAGSIGPPLVIMDCSVSASVVADDSREGGSVSVADRRRAFVSGC